MAICFAAERERERETRLRRGERWWELTCLDMHLAAAHEPGWFSRKPFSPVLSSPTACVHQHNMDPKEKCLGLQRMLKKEEGKVVVKRDAEKFIARGSRIR